MKTILVKALAARESGAMTILRETLRAAQADPENRYVFLTGVPLDNTGVQIITPPGIHVSLLSRSRYELFGIRRALKETGADEILSLDNLAVFGVRLPQTLYLQNAIPFAGGTYSLRNSPRLWLYRYPLRPLFVRSVRKARCVIVQTEWMKTLCAGVCRVSGERFRVCPPYADLPETDAWHGSARFFYPATPWPYKDHAVLFQAAALLKKEGWTPEIRLTLTKEQCAGFGSAYAAVSDAAVPLGTLDETEMREQYSRCVLVFPSRIESCGLPLREARLVGAPVLAADTPFAREALDGYGRASYFPPGDARALADAMRAIAKTLPKEPIHASETEKRS